jgi:hypothetical protein
MQDGFDKHNVEMNLDIRKPKKKVKKLLDKLKVSFTNRPDQAWFTECSSLLQFSGYSFPHTKQVQILVACTDIMVFRNFTILTVRGLEES